MIKKVKIMIVEDDETLAGEIRSFLLKWGYQVALAQKFDDITGEFMEYSPGLVLMDVNLPACDGFYWCTRIRQISQVPIIFISSRNADRDKITAIAQGGDDYVEKPFRLGVLKAKVEAILRRTYQYRVKEEIYVSSGMHFHPDSQSLYFEGKEIELTKTERKILAKLMEEKPEVVSRNALLMELWDTDEYVSDGTLTTAICRLRSKLKAACGEDPICTRKGQGYSVQ